MLADELKPLRATYIFTLNRDILTPSKFSETLIKNYYTGKIMHNPIKFFITSFCILCACVMILNSLPVEAAAKTRASKDGSQIQPDNYYPKVKLITSMGEFVVELDRRKAPITVNNFLKYVDLRSYEDTIFHRVIPGFVVQGGGYTAEFEPKPALGTIFNESGNGLKNETYTIAMARQNDPHSATRQFYFNMRDTPSLDPGRNWGYAVFGYVAEGSEVLDAISAVETHYSMNLRAPDVPIEAVMLLKAEILPEVTFD